MRIEDLNQEQQEAVRYFDGPLLVLAGAGSGKTRVITNKIIHLVGDYGVDLDRILAITFTNKAAKEMSNRVVESLQLEVPPPWITTFHSMGAKILRQDANDVGYDKNFIIYDESESSRVVKQVLNGLNLTDSLYDTGEIRDAISKVKQSLNQDLLNFYDTEYPMFKIIFMTYVKALKMCNAVDFDDLLGLVYKLFRINENVLLKWQKKFDYFLVDEYQDTNKAQHEVFRFLVGDSKNITVVGDPYQCWAGDGVVNTQNGNKLVSELKVGDLVESYRLKGLRYEEVTNIKINNDSQIFLVRTKTGNVLRVTKDHLMFVKHSNKNSGIFLYLMFRYDMGFRIGITNGNGLDFFSRRSSELADKMWIIGRYDKIEDALYNETRYSLLYGIPTVPFVTHTRKMKLVGEHLLNLFYEFGNNGYKLLNDLQLNFNYPNSLPKGVNSISRANVNITVGSKHHEVSFEVGGRKSVNRIRRYFSSYKDAYFFASALKVGVKARDIREQLHFKYHDHLSVVPLSQLTDTMFIPIVRNNEILLDEVVEIKPDGIEKSYDIEVAKSGNMIVNGILSHNCIYEWRGAHSDNILKFDHEFPSTKTIKLERNYRSTNNILTAANAIISKCTGAYKDKVLRLHTEIDDGEDIILREFHDRDKEALYVASEIRKLKNLKGYNWGDFAILVRLTFLTRFIEDALMGFKIPYQVVGGLRFGQRKEIRDLVSYLSLIHNPRDQVAFERILSVPPRGLGKAALALINDQDEENCVEKLRSAISKMNKMKKSRDGAEKLLKILDFVSERANDFPHDTLAYVYNSIGYETYLKDKYKNESYDRILNIKELMLILKKVQDNKETLSEWMEENKLISDQDNIDEKNSVKIMTIHAAKGLEFPIVFLVGLEEGILPCKMAMTPEQLEEERRLFYVASTRPKDQLRLSYAITEYGNNYQQTRAIPSRYLVDIKDYVKFI